jgi:hypothetical protein
MGRWYQRSGFADWDCKSGVINFGSISAEHAGLWVTIRPMEVRPDMFSDRQSQGWYHRNALTDTDMYGVRGTPCKANDGLCFHDKLSAHFESSKINSAFPAKISDNLNNSSASRSTNHTLWLASQRLDKHMRETNHYSLNMPENICAGVDEVVNTRQFRMAHTGDL